MNTPELLYKLDELSKSYRYADRGGSEPLNAAGQELLKKSLNEGQRRVFEFVGIRDKTNSRTLADIMGLSIPNAFFLLKWLCDEGYLSRRSTGQDGGGIEYDYYIRRY